MNYDTVVLDGELNLTIIGFADVELEIEEDGEFGAYTKIAVSDVYDGPYSVIPRLSQQVLDTNDKIMTDDVTVYGIPISYTSNPYDGKTVLIG